MATSCDAAGVLAAVRSVVGVVARHRDELVELDRTIGDGDHGENLRRGFTAVEAKLGHSPWVAAVDLAVREMAAGKPLEA